MTKKVNSEKTFSLIFVDSSKAPMNQCFERVWGKGNADIGNCSNFTEGLKLPLSIKMDSSTFYFSKEGKTDTLAISYLKSFEPQSDEFEVKYIIKKLNGTFKNISQECVSDITPQCDGNKTYLSAVIYK